MSIVLDGKATAAAIRQELKDEITARAPQAERGPGLAVILVGEDPASQVYVRNKEKACESTGIASFAHRLKADVTQAELERLIDYLNDRPEVDGILLQLPLPKGSGLDSQALLERIDPSKDVDGFHPVSMGKLALGLPGFKPCTPAGVIELLRRYGLSPAGKKAVVVGRSNIVGKPLAILLASHGEFGDATVTLCHSRTPNLGDECASADFLFVAVGMAACITKAMVKPGAVVVDVGINRDEDGKLCGDCDYAPIAEVAAAITPVPGGVGPMTIAMLLTNTVAAWKAHCGLA
ncbi:MAG: bifunctional methylenetetrahydrofolate dehydrogenase/methenyltetrahydrofolate cyclohydrolase FolD [Desulfovibrionaceae bacterium]|jgi:methylenetetrahydrofolate dehydrogenase (NADP+)/methenyltetrahydrofolate cyclohydrolase|nr:bifunctional methylenetetrahydrofolate dehydrogenase/methenyltetrahydrofolate cyclohydrolase FolD [Desulfovibrionaceae bacterium]